MNNTLNKDLQEVKQILEDTAKGKTVNRIVYSIPEEWLVILKKNNIKFSSFAKDAISEKIKKIKDI